MFDQDARSAISKINQVSSFLRDRYSGMEELIDLMINCVRLVPDSHSLTKIKIRDGQ